MTSAAPFAVVPPEGFVWPELDPTGIELEVRELGPGVFALVSGQISVNNSGFVVGRESVLVIDAQLTAAMARQVQAAIRKVTSRPIRYLVNTTAHGDHTFGNCAFPAEVQIIAHRAAAEQMASFERERHFLRHTVRDPALLDDVELRRPDVVFDNSLEFDLGGQVVAIHHFGRGNSPGDAVVFAPAAGVAWTGNLTLGEGMVPFVMHGRAGDYLQTTAKFAATLAVETIIAGHGPPTTARAFSRDLGYLADLQQGLERSVRSGNTVERTLEVLPLPEELAAAAQPGYQRRLIEGYHRWNVSHGHALLTHSARPGADRVRDESVPG